VSNYDLLRSLAITTYYVVLTIYYVRQ